MAVTSTVKYSARPPHTPATVTLSADRSIRLAPTITGSEPGSASGTMIQATT